MKLFRLDVKDKKGKADSRFQGEDGDSYCVEGFRVRMNEGLTSAPEGEGGDDKDEEGSEDPLLDLVMSDVMGLGEEPVQSLEEVLR